MHQAETQNAEEGSTALGREFTAQTGISVRENVSADRYTTFYVGGNFAYLIEVNTVAEVVKSVKALRSLHQNWSVIGFGSNLVVPSAGVQRWVMKLGKGFRSVNQMDQSRFSVGAATALMALSREMSAAGLSGLEFAGGIPASVGGAVRMNAGAHSGEMSQVVEQIEYVNDRAQVVHMSAKDLSFEYRSVNIPEGAIVTGATLCLVKSTQDKTTSSLKENLEYRKRTQPLTLPSAGSVFRNPCAALSAGSLLEECGMKGLAIGGAKISELHANWIVNEARSASSEDVWKLVAKCQSEVWQQRGVRLEPEIIQW